MEGLKKLKCKKELGKWYYIKTEATISNDLDAPIWSLYRDEDGEDFVNDFGSYGDMKYYIETGIVL